MQERHGIRISSESDDLVVDMEEAYDSNREHKGRAENYQINLKIIQLKVDDDWQIIVESRLQLSDLQHNHPGHAKHGHS